jgi:hypothetical protein
MSIFFLKLSIILKPLISSLLWNLHHENISLCSKGCKFHNKEEIKGFNMMDSFKKNIDI